MFRKGSKTPYTFRLIALLPLVSMLGCEWLAGTLDTTAPTVSSTNSDDANTGVPINKRIAATFSEAMNPLTITAATFTVTGPGTTPVSGTVTYAVVATTAIFTPTSNLASNTTFTATITTVAEDLAGNALARNFVWTFTTAAAPDVTAPTVTSTTPVNTAAGVPINRDITATFSEAMDPLTITSATFVVTGPGTTAMSGTVTYAAVGASAIFTPAGHLAAGTTFTATLTTGVRDLAGNALTTNFVWSFTTGATPDATAPTVTATHPGNADTGVPINERVAATFGEAMDALTITTATFTVTGPGTTPVVGTVAYAAVGTRATFTPTSNLAGNTLFTATITTGAGDLAGNALASDFVWTFTTGTTQSTTAPALSFTVPAHGAIGVATNGEITATFNEAMDPATITTGTFTVTDWNATPVSGAVTLVAAGTTAIFTPASNLAGNTVFTATITTGARNLAGDALASAVVWSFTTGATVAAGPAPVVLGTAGHYVILAKSGISTVPTSAVAGDLGVSPIDSTAITGFSLVLDGSTQFARSSQVTGRLYAADYTPPTPAALTTAVSNMETAYTDAAGRAADVTDLGAGNIGGRTLVPGVYKWGTGVTIPTDVTLSGGPNDVWIFQIAGDLTMAGAKTVILSGGALPKNIFWQVAGGAGVTLGAAAHFEGIVLTQTAIHLGNTASVNGRLLAQTAVTLEANTVTQPAP